MARARFPRRAAAAAAACVVAGCYREVAVPWREAPRGQDVDLVLVESEAPALVAQLGPRARAVVGRVRDRSDSGLTLAVAAVTRANGVEEGWPGNEVAVPARAVARVTVRRVSAARTALIAIAIAGAGALVGGVAGDGSASQGGRVGGPTNPR